MRLEGVVGSQNNADSSSILVAARMGRQGDQLVSGLHGKLFEQALRGNLFSVANQAAVTTTAALATTYTGLVVGNPAGSGVNLAVAKFQCAQFAVGAAGAVGIMTGPSTTAITDTLVPRNAKVGGARSLAVANAGQTIGTPVLERIFGEVGSLATTGYGLQQGIDADLDGSLIIPPGCFMAAYTTVVTTSALLFGFMWEEVPIGS